MVGCGNSKLSEEMAVHDNFLKITNIDISEVVLEKMKVHNSKIEKCNEFKYMTVDATDMKEFTDETFDITFDKGTYDALACDPSDKTMI